MPWMPGQSQTGSSYIKGVVNDFSALPSAALNNGNMYYAKAGSGGLLAGIGFYKYPAGHYISDGATWTLAQIQSTISEDAISVSNVTSWADFFATVSDINLGDRIIYDGIVYINITGNFTSSDPITDTINWTSDITFSTNTTSTPITVQAFNAGAAAGGISFRRGRGTKSTPTQTKTDDVLGGLFFAGTTDTGVATGNIVAMRVLAAEDHTATNQGAYLSFSTTPVGGTGRLQRINVSAAGSLTHTMAGAAPTGISTQNTDNGTSSETRMTVLSNDGTDSIAIAVPAAGNTAAALFGLSRADSAFIFSNSSATRNFGIGTADNKDLIFGTNNTERMRILNSGYVGIGVTNPDNLLTVIKSSNSGADTVVPAIKVANSLATQGNGTTTYNFSNILATAGNGTVVSFLGASYASDAVYGSCMRLGTTTNHGVKFHTNNTEVASLTPGGYMKIGPSTAPAIRVKKLIGTTGATAGLTYLTHGIEDSTKIIAVNIKITPTTYVGTPPGYPSAAFSYAFYHDATYIVVETAAGATSIFSRDIFVSIIYEE